MDLRRRFDEVLQVCPKGSHMSALVRSSHTEQNVGSPGQEVAEVDKFTMLLVFNIDHSPPILSAADTFTINHHCALGSDDREGNHCL